MPTLDQIVKDKLSRLESVPRGMVDASIEGQKRLLSEVERILSTMEMQDGRFLLTESNIMKLETVNNLLSNAVFNNDYTASLTSYISEFNTQAELSDEYFKVVSNEFQVSGVYDATLLNSQKNAITLLSGDAVAPQVVAPISQTIQTAISSGQSFTEVMDTIRNFVTPEEGVGVLERYVKGIAYDAFAVSDRSYTDTIAKDLELEFYLYQGGEIDTTRCFCDERNGKYYHRKEIEEWGDRKNIGSCALTMSDGSRGWAGMNKNTNKQTIFVFVGGYNCGHALLPVSLKSVPKSVIDRARARGFYKK